MDSKLRAELIRQGNAAFDEKDLKRARECFVKANYRDGLIRLGDHYMYERRLPLLAYGYYKKAGDQVKLEDLHRRMLGALSEWIGKDRFKEGALGAPTGTRRTLQVEPDGMIAVPVSPDLKKMALQILEKKS